MPLKLAAMPRWNIDQSKPSASAKVAALDHLIGLF